MADDDLTVVVHEQVEKALRRIYGRAYLVVFTTTVGLVIVYSAAHDYLEVFFPESSALAAVASAISCHTPLFFMIQDLCRLSELQPDNIRTIILLTAVAVLGIVGLLALAYSAAYSLHVVRRVYDSYIVGDLRYTHKRFLWLLLGVGSALLNTVAQIFAAHTRTYDPEFWARAYTPTTRFWMTLLSIGWIYWALLQIVQFAVFAGLVYVKRHRLAHEPAPPSQPET